MNDNIPPPENPRGDAPPSQGVPWGQLTVASFGLCSCLYMVGKVLRLLGIPDGDVFEIISGLLFLCGLAFGVTTAWQSRFGIYKGRPLPHRAWLRIVNICLWATYLMSVLLMVLVPGVRAGMGAAQRTQQKNSAKISEDLSLTRVVSPDGRWLVEVPSGWRDISSTITPNVWQIAQSDQGDQMGALVAILPREDLTARSLQEYAQMCLSHFPMEFEQVEVLETTSVSTVKGSMQQVLIAGANDGVRIMMLLQFIETPQSYIQLRVWGLPSAFREHEPLLRSVLGSFRATGVTSPPPAP